MWSIADDISIHPDIVDKESQYLCIKCCKGLLHPRQLLCGHRVCSPCLEHIQLNSSNSKSVSCPAKRIEDCEDSPINMIFTDKSIEKDMKNIKVYCPYKLSGCDKVFPYSHLQDHIGEFHLSYLLSQSNTEKICNRRCKFLSIGCQKYFEQDSDLYFHEHDIVAHIDIILQRFYILEKENLHLEECLKLLNKEADELEQQRKHAEDEYAKLSDIIEKLERMKIQQKDTISHLERPFAQLENIHEKNPFILQEETRNALIEHDRTLAKHDVSLADMDSKIKEMENTSYDGTLIWKVENYHSKKNVMDHRPYTSPIFFTSRYGYKMSCRLYLNGDGSGRGDHTSLFFVLLKGDYDNILQWPFSKKVSFTLINQSNATKNIIYTFDPDRGPSFQKPKDVANIAIGCPLFVRHSVLENPDEAFLKNDTIYIRIVAGDETKQTNLSVKN